MAKLSIAVAVACARPVAKAQTSLRLWHGPKNTQPIRNGTRAGSGTLRVCRSRTTSGVNLPPRLIQTMSLPGRRSDAFEQVAVMWDAPAYASPRQYECHCFPVSSAVFSEHTCKVCINLSPWTNFPRPPPHAACRPPPQHKIYISTLATRTGEEMHNVRP